MKLHAVEMLQKPCQTTAQKPKIFRPWEATSPTKDHKIYVEEFAMHDSGYHSDHMNSPSKSKTRTRTLNSKAVQLMEQWYKENLHHPYPSHQVIRYLSSVGGITVTQVKKWMANKRVRSCNTLTMNGSPHPNRMKKLQKNMSNIQTRNACADPCKSPMLHVTKFPDSLPHQLTLPLQYFNWFALQGYNHHQKLSALDQHTIPMSYYGHAGTIKY